MDLEVIRDAQDVMGTDAPTHRQRHPPAGGEHRHPPPGRGRPVQQGQGGPRHVRGLDRARRLPQGRPRLHRGERLGQRHRRRPLEGPRRGLGGPGEPRPGHVHRPARAADRGGGAPRRGAGPPEPAPLRQPRASTSSRRPGASRWSCGTRSGESPATRAVLLDTKTAEVDLGATGGWVYPKADGQGYYRWQVPDEVLMRLTTEASTILSDAERMDLVGNLSALLGAGTLDGGRYLAALEGLAARSGADGRGLGPGLPERGPAALRSGRPGGRVRGLHPPGAATGAGRRRPPAARAARARPPPSCGPASSSGSATTAGTRRSSASPRSRPPPTSRIRARSLPPSPGPA